MTNKEKQDASPIVLAIIKFLSQEKMYSHIFEQPFNIFIDKLLNTDTFNTDEKIIEKINTLSIKYFTRKNKLSEKDMALLLGIFKWIREFKFTYSSNCVRLIVDKSFNGKLKMYVKNIDKINNNDIFRLPLNIIEDLDSIGYSSPNIENMIRNALTMNKYKDKKIFSIIMEKENVKQVIQVFSLIGANLYLEEDNTSLILNVTGKIAKFDNALINAITKYNPLHNIDIKENNTIDKYLNIFF